MFHDNSNHIEVRYHFIRDMVQKGVVNIKYAPKEEQVAYALTKPLSCVKLKYFQDKFGVARKDLSRNRE